MNKSKFLGFLLISTIIISGCDKKVKSNTNNQQIALTNSQIDSTEALSIVLPEPTIIEKTLSQIDSLKKELYLKEKDAEEEIAGLVNTNPIFAVKDQFESTVDYADRVKQRQPIINSIKEQYCNDTWQELRILRESIFESQNFEILLKDYDADSQIYRITIQHYDYPDKIKWVFLNINQADAKFLHDNWIKFENKFIYAIGINDEIDIVQIIFFEPNSKFEFIHTFKQKVFTVECNEDCIKAIMSRSISNDGNLISYFVNYSPPCNMVYVYNIMQRNYTHFFPDTEFLKNFNPYRITFSTNSQYIISFDNEYSKDDQYINKDISVFDLKTNKIIENCRKKENKIFDSNGHNLCTIRQSRWKSKNDIYEISPSYDYKIDVYRTSILPDSSNLKIVQEVNKIDFIETISNEESNIRSSSSNSDETELNEYRKKKFLNSSVDDIDSRGTGLSKEEVEWLYQEAKKQGYCD